jgi:demethylmenaquinone methyltransferase/2-methoxy-6-polyprenyl-1,4-benzoquinol methylase
MFSEIAGRYDFLNHLLSLGVDRYWRSKTVRVVPPDGDRPILDVCTGTADLALAYVRVSGGRVQVIGADFARPMLTIAREKSQRAACGGALVPVEADAQRLPFPDDAFQIVCVAFGLRNVTHTDRGLEEMVRVCHPGGRVAILEFTMPERWPLRPIYRWYFRRVLPRVGQALAKNRQGAYNYLPASVGTFPQKEELADAMVRAGLHAVRYHSLTFGIATLYVGTK